MVNTRDNDKDKINRNNDYNYAMMIIKVTCTDPSDMRVSAMILSSVYLRVFQMGITSSPSGSKTSDEEVARNA